VRGFAVWGLDRFLTGLRDLGLDPVLVENLQKIIVRAFHFREIRLLIALAGMTIVAFYRARVTDPSEAIHVPKPGCANNLYASPLSPSLNEFAIDSPQTRLYSLSKSAPGLCK
jgi:hypothetical protein